MPRISDPARACVVPTRGDCGGVRPRPILPALPADADDEAVGERSDDDEAAAMSEVRFDGGATALTTTARGVVLITPTRHCETKRER